MNEKLTPDRIEAARAGHEKRIKKWETAITERQEEIEKYPWKGIPTFPDVNDWRESEIVRRRRQIDDAETAIAALDLAERFRWRPVTSNDPDIAETVLLKPNEQETSIKLPFIGFRTRREQRKVFYSLSGDEWYESELLAYMPLPMMEVYGKGACR